MVDENSIESGVKATSPENLLNELEQSLTDGSWFREQIQENERTRFAIWDGQSTDGRKHEDELGEEPLPWEGASDTRIRLADEIINDHVRVMKSAFKRCQIQASGRSVKTMPDARRAEMLLRYMLEDQMASNMENEVPLAADLRESDGLVLMLVDWDRQTRSEKVNLNVQELQELGQKMLTEDNNRSMLDLLAVLTDPSQEEKVMDGLRERVPGLSAGEARRIVRELRDKGESSYDTPTVFINRPRIQALRVGVDVWFPVETTDLQRARWICYREWLSESELRDKINTDDWDQSWVEQAVTKKGGSSSTTRAAIRTREDLATPEERANLVEVYHFYYKAMDGDSPKVWHTVLHRDIPDDFALKVELEHKHGEYPFVDGKRERNSRLLLNSRGVSEIVSTWQSEKKHSRDGRTDRKDVATLPPTCGPQEVQFGPGAHLRSRRPGEYWWFPTPPHDSGAKEIEDATQADADAYFGRMVPGVHPSKMILCQQDLADSWLDFMRRVLVMIWKLMQQYMEPVEIVRVLGGMYFPVHFTKEDIRGQYDFRLTFDARDLDLETLVKKLDFYKNILVPLDTSGIVDRNSLVRMAAWSLDPIGAQTMLRPEEAATQSEIDEEKQAWAQMAAGVEPSFHDGMNFSLRLQVLEQIIGANPEIAAVLDGNSKGVFAQLVERRRKAFEFQLTQQRNAVIGRLGMDPGKPLAGAAAGGGQ